jgi:hypothetical protein
MSSIQGDVPQCDMPWHVAASNHLKAMVPPHLLQSWKDSVSTLWRNASEKASAVLFEPVYFEVLPPSWQDRLQQWLPASKTLLHVTAAVHS